MQEYCLSSPNTLYHAGMSKFKHKLWKSHLLSKPQASWSYTHLRKKDNSTLIHRCKQGRNYANRMMSSNGNIFRITGHLCREFPGPRWIFFHKGQWHGALMFSLICAWIYDWVNNRKAGDLRRYRAHHDNIVMKMMCTHNDKFSQWKTCINQPNFFHIKALHWWFLLGESTRVQ